MEIARVSANHPQRANSLYQISVVRLRRVHQGLFQTDVARGTARSDRCGVRVERRCPAESAQKNSNNNGGRSPPGRARQSRTYSFLGVAALHGVRRSGRHAPELLVADAQAAEDGFRHVRVEREQETPVQAEDGARQRRGRVPRLRHGVLPRQRSHEHTGSGGQEQRVRPGTVHVVRPAAETRDERGRRSVLRHQRFRHRYDFVVFLVSFPFPDRREGGGTPLNRPSFYSPCRQTKTRRSTLWRSRHVNGSSKK